MIKEILKLLKPKPKCNHYWELYTPILENGKPDYSSETISKHLVRCKNCKEIKSDISEMIRVCKRLNDEAIKSGIYDKHYTPSELNNFKKYD